jgi:uncharacterized lipoprotein
MNHPPTLERRTAVVVALCFALGPGCDARSDTPVEAYKSFVKAIQKGEVKTAFGGLSQQTQSTLRQRAKELSTASGGAIKDEPEALLLAPGAPRESLSEVKLERQDGNRAVVVAAAGNRQAVPMVREGSAWKLDLAEFINPGATAKPSL